MVQSETEIVVFFLDADPSLKNAEAPQTHTASVPPRIRQQPFRSDLRPTTLTRTPTAGRRVGFRGMQGIGW